MGAGVVPRIVWPCSSEAASADFRLYLDSKQVRALTAATAASRAEIRVTDA